MSRMDVTQHSHCIVIWNGGAIIRELREKVEVTPISKTVIHRSDHPLSVLSLFISSDPVLFVGVSMHLIY